MASPFKVFRKHQKVLIATLGLLAMIAFVFLPMILEGLNQGGGSKDPVVVTSKYGDLTESQLQQMRARRQNVVNFLQRAVSVAGFDRQTTMARQMYIDRFFSDVSEESTVDLWLLVQRAKSLGMTVSDKAVSDFITSTVTDNRVTNEQFANLYKTMKLSEDLVFDTLQDELLAQELQVVFSKSMAGTTPAQRWEYFQRLNRKVELEVAAVPVSSYVHQVEDPDDDTLEAYFEEHKGDLPNPMSPEPGFRVPSKASVEYVKADVSKYLEATQVSDKEIEEYYKKHRDSKYLNLPGLSEGDAKPVDKKPADKKQEEKKPAETKSKAVESKKPAEPKKEPPKKEAPKKDAPAPEAKKSSSLDSKSPFRLVSMAEEKKSTEKKAESKPVAKPTENKAKPAEKKADPKPAAKKPEPKPAAIPTEKETAPKPVANPDAKKPAEKKPAVDSKYRPLDEVREEIRQILSAEKRAAAMKAFEEVEKAFQPIQDAVSKYRRDLSLYNATKEEGAEKPTPPDFDALAKKNGLTYHKTGLIQVSEMAALDIGRSIINSGQTFLNYIYSTSNLNRPQMATDMGQNVYMFWKTDSSEEEVPEFEDEGIRADVLEAWKLEKAREIARGEAEKLAKEAAKSGESLAKSIGGSRSVEKTGPFTWMTRAPVPGAQGRTRLLMSRVVKNVDRPGDKFMRAVYDLEVGETGVAMNQPENVAYVVQLQKTEPSDTVLWIGFQADPYSVYAAVGDSDQFQVYKAWIDGIRKDANLKWERKPVPPVRRQR